MSVVNKMLNDLEQRDKASAGQHQNYQPSEKKNDQIKRVAVYGILAVLIGIVAVLYWFDEANQPQSMAKANIVQPTTRVIQEQIPVVKASESTPSTENAPAVVETMAVGQTTTTEQVSVSQPQTAVVNTQTPEDVTTIESDKPEPDKPEPDKPEPDKPEPAKLAVAPSNGVQKAPYQMLAADALARNNTEDAIDALRQWVQAEPKALDARKKLAALYFANGQLQAVQIMLEETRDLFPEEPSVRLMLARLYTNTKDPEKVWDALTIETRDAEFLLYRAALARQQNRMQQAFSDYQLLTGVAPTEFRAWLGLGVVSESLNKTDIAIASFQQVLQLTVGQPEISDYASARLQILEGNE